ncbi:hypothetical protein SLA2020_268830 [Shorea laevis]
MFVGKDEVLRFAFFKVRYAFLSYLHLTRVRSSPFSALQLFADALRSTPFDVHTSARGSHPPFTAFYQSSSPSPIVGAAIFWVF